MINIISSCCINNNNKILMVQENKKEVDGLWNLPGGKVKENENIKNAAIREILEETGYNIQIDSLLLIQNYITPKGELLILYFNASLIDSKQGNYIRDEIKNVKWMTIQEIENIPEEKIRGGNGIKKIIYNIENDIKYPLDIIDIYE